MSNEKRFKTRKMVFKDLISSGNKVIPIDNFYSAVKPCYTCGSDNVKFLYLVCSYGNNGFIYIKAKYFCRRCDINESR